MAEIILAKGKPTSLKKAVLFRLSVLSLLWRSLHLFRSIMPLTSTAAKDTLFMLERSILHSMTPLPGHTEINKVDFIGFLVSALVFEVEITKSVFIPLLVYESITHLDKMNKILAEGGSDKKWTAEEYVRDQFEKAMKETMLRAEDKVVK